MDSKALDGLARKFSREHMIPGGPVVIEGGGIDVARRPHASVDFDTMEAVIARSRPAVVHVETEAFDLEAEVSAFLDGLKVRDEDGAFLAAMTAALAPVAAGHAGETVTVVACVAVEGVFVVATATAEWFDAFVDRLEAVYGEVLDAVSTTREATAAQGAQALRALAETLLADGRFNAPKATRAKREFLAREMFPDVGAKGVDAVVTEAENLAWMREVSHLAGTPEAPAS